MAWELNGSLVVGSIAGAVCGSSDFITSRMDLHLGSLMLLGPTMDPQVAYGVSMRLPHLGLRMAEHSRRAGLFASRLEQLGLPVLYPGLAAHPDHSLLERTGNAAYGAGGIFCLDMGTAAEANRFMELLQNEDRFGLMAVSLGFFETLLSCPARSTSSEMSADELEKAGIRHGLLRISIGYTGSVEQRSGQLQTAQPKMGSLPVQV